MSNIKTYSVYLPVYKQGDDLASYLNSDGSNGPEAFNLLAEQYEAAAEMCRSISNKIKPHFEIVVDADCHSIMIHAKENQVKSLLESELIQEDECFDEEDEELS